MGILTFSKNKFVWRGSFEERVIPRAQGFSWDANLKKWITEKPDVAIKLLKYADAKTLKYLTTNFGNDLDKPENFITCGPKDKTYMPFQEEGIRFLLSKKNAGLFDDMGLGKTIQAIGVINSSDPKSVLIIMPPFLMLNWKKELDAWLISHYKIVEVNSGKDKFPVTDFPTIYLVPDSLLYKIEIHSQLMRREFDLCLVDECHRFKNKLAKRTIALYGYEKDKQYGLISKSRQVKVFSGTPMPNRPIELFSMLNALCPIAIGFKNYFDYGQKYCGGYQDSFGWHFDGASNTKELSENIKHHFALRRRKAEVLPDLPGRFYQNIYVNADGPKFKQFSKLDAELKAKHDVSSIDEIMELGEMATYRKELGEIKVEASLDIIENLLSSNEGKKLVIFAHHKNVIERLYKALAHYRPFVITGATPKDVRHSFVESFQSDPSRRLFIGNIQACGVGITLTAASLVLFVEYSWVSSENDQAIDRCHRIGQNDSVIAQFIVMEDTLDANILRSNISKNKIIKEVIG